jgi:hypothetical protein
MMIRRCITSFASLLAALAVLLAGLSPLLAQAPKAKAPKIPDPEDVTLETKDGVSIRATFYAGLGKKASIPVIMVHGWEGQRGEYHALAKGLQTLGHSIIVPDLRGHGQSTTQKLPNDTTKELDPSRFRPADLDGMVRDIEACKRFLMDKNNQGELNINSLCVVAAEFGCIPAMKWTALDLTAPRLLAMKQGQDVKAVVLLSPVQAFKGVTMNETLNLPAIRSELSMMIVAGKQDSKSNDAKRLHGKLENFRPKVPTDPEEIKKKQDLFLVQPETSLQGTKLLGSGLPVMGNIAKFIELRLEAKQADYPWSDRSRGE